MKKHSSMRMWTAAAVMGWLVGFAFLHGGSQTSFADVDCSDHQNVEASTQNDAGNWVTARGFNVYPGDYIDTPSTPSCLRVASLSVLKDNNNLTEDGWVIDSTTLPGECNHGIGAGHPYRLILIVTGGASTCYPSGQPPEVTGLDQFHQVEMNDPNRDGAWDYYWNSDFVVTLFSSFVNGTLLTNGERYGHDDDVFSDFDGLQMNIGGPFTPWTNRHCYFDNNEDAKNVYPAGEKDHVKVKNLVGSCPSGD